MKNRLLISIWVYDRSGWKILGKYNSGISVRISSMDAHMGEAVKPLKCPEGKWAISLETPYESP